ncbi:RsiV family protein [Nocardia sp. NPDC127526]|uniref:RsiV family protein n=1 Tax=Nocardia sp. NPDC127526 TaxID=3345393 RepID=UPI003638A577
MKRISAAHVLLAFVFAVLTTVSGAVIARADTPDRLHGTEYTIKGYQYEVRVPQLAGGTETERASFNEAMRLSADEYIGYVDHVTSVYPAHSEVVYIGAHVASGKLGVEIYKEGAAHGYEEFVTHNTWLATGQPVYLADLFTDFQGALNVLSEQAAVLVPQTAAGENYSRAAIEPYAANYEKWAVTRDGLRVYFGEIGSHAAGNIHITVPWSAVEHLMLPEMKTIGEA